MKKFSNLSFAVLMTLAIHASFINADEQTTTPSTTTTEPGNDHFSLETS
jgi:hypothetical protein